MNLNLFQFNKMIRQAAIDTFYLGSFASCEAGHRFLRFAMAYPETESAKTSETEIRFEQYRDESDMPGADKPKW